MTWIVTRAPGAVRSPCQCHTPLPHSAIEPFGHRMGTPPSRVSSRVGDRRWKWLPGMTHVGPTSSVQSSSTQQATAIMPNSGNGLRISG